MASKIRDLRVKTVASTWFNFLVTVVLLICLTILPPFLLGGGEAIKGVPSLYVWLYTLYWAVIVGLFFSYSSYQKRKAYDEPMRKLSQAAKRVAEGDFSVYLEPRHTTDRYDYIDVMFQDFNKMVQDLGSLETMKSDFIANVSHEIKTPLSNIQSYAVALQNDKISKEDRKDYISTIVSSSDKLTSLVTNILKLNRIENQTTNLEYSAFDICKQLSESALLFEDVWGKKNINFVVNMDDKATIVADEGMLEIIWHNLISNAIKFTEPGGTITLTQTSTDKHATVSISDTGSGMSEETLSQVFDKFYQGDSSHSAEGNGLGLTLVSKVIELIGGELLVQSDLNKGTTFTVKLRLEPKKSKN